MENNTVDKQSMVRLEAKVRDLETRLELEQTTRTRVEVSDVIDRHRHSAGPTSKSLAQHCADGGDSEIPQMVTFISVFVL